MPLRRKTGLSCTPGHLTVEDAKRYWFRRGPGLALRKRLAKRGQFRTVGRQVLFESPDYRARITCHNVGMIVGYALD